MTNNQVLIHRSDESIYTPNPSTQQPSSTTASPIPSRSSSSQLRIEPTPTSILLETWTLTFAPHGSDHKLGDQGELICVFAPQSLTNIVAALPTIYKHGIPLFRSLYSLLRVLPVWKLFKRLKRRTGGVNRNGHLGISLRVRPVEETNEMGSALGILAFGGFSLHSDVLLSIFYSSDGQ